MKSFVRENDSEPEFDWVREKTMARDNFSNMVFNEMPQIHSFGCQLHIITVCDKPENSKNYLIKSNEILLVYVSIGVK